MRHALVTGGAGFIGSHVVEALLDDGWLVSVIDNFDNFYDPGMKRANLAACMADDRFRLYEVDVRDSRELDRLPRDQVDVIVHLAARAGVRPSIADPGVYEEVNVRGTQNLLQMAKERSIEQFIFASSSSVYGTNSQVPWSEEERGLMPISPYAATKVAAELVGHVFSHLYGTRFIALRLFTAFGPRQRPDLAIHKFARLMLERKPIPVYGDGSTSRDYTYVGDLVEGICSAVEYTGSRYEIVNLGSGRSVSLMEMIRGLETVLNIEAKLEFLPEQPGDVPRTWANIGKARRLFGYEPQTGLLDGLARFAGWVLDHRSVTGQ